MSDSKTQSNKSKVHFPINVLVTGAVVVVAAVLVWIVFNRYFSRPWTRSGQVRADIVAVTTYVSGKVVEVHVKDEQLVEAGQLLFAIDPSSYEIAVQNAKISLDEAREQVAALEAAVTAAKAGVEVAKAGIGQAKAAIVQYEASLVEAGREAVRNAALAKTGAGSVEAAQQSEAKRDAIQAGLDSARAGLVSANAHLASAIASQQQAEATLGQSGDENVRIRAAKAALANAELNLERTKVLAPSAGWISNLTLRRGDWAAPGQAQMMFIDKASLRISGYFKETQLPHIKHGDRAVITLMGLSGRPLEGVVESIGRAINPPSIATVQGNGAMVPQIAPSYDWIRLAQRVPVTIRFKEIPDDIVLVAGATVSVAIDPGGSR
jgi:multidrug resistance efflux pump